MSSAIFGEDPSDSAAFAYDAATALALALHESGQPAPTGLDSSQRAAVLSRLLNSSFDGATGVVTFESSGDRSTAGLAYSLDNFAWNGSVLSRRRVRLVHGGSVHVVGEVVWLEGSTEAPRDGVRAASGDGTLPASVVGAVSFVSVAGAAVAFLLVLVVHRYLRRQRELQQRASAFELEQEAKVDRALEIGNELQFACVTILATDFVALDRLYSHEELRDRGLLKSHDRLRELRASKGHLIFFSHQVRYSSPRTRPLSSRLARRVERGRERRRALARTAR